MHSALPVAVAWKLKLLIEIYLLLQIVVIEMIIVIRLGGWGRREAKPPDDR